MAIRSQTLKFQNPNSPSPPFILLLLRTLSSSSLWSMKKDPFLESSLTRNRRWIINNQIKNIILRCPNQVAPILFLQKKFRSLDLQGSALNWVKKYPCCFSVYLENNLYYCRLTKPMMGLVDEEELVMESQEGVLVERLGKLLLMSRNYKLNVVKFNGIKRNFGFPDDYLIRLLPKYPEMFKVVSYGNKRNSMEIELVSWDSKLGVSVVESRGLEIGEGPRFTCLLPSTWMKGLERFREFNENIPYISPYKLDCDGNEFVEESEEAEKRAVGVVHELLSLTLWKKMSIMKLSRFSREFNLPKKLNGLLLKHPGIFYVTNKYQIHTVMLREGYNGSDLCVKDPLVVVKDKFGALMQEGLHEYRLRRTDLNLERKKKKGMDFVRPVKRVKSSVSDDSEKDDDRVGGKRGGILSDPEERKRFYKVLFEDEVPKD